MPSSVAATSSPDGDLEPLLAGYRARLATPADAFGLRAVELRAIRLAAAPHYRPIVIRSWTRGVTLETYVKALDDGARIEAAVDLAGHIVGFCQTNYGMIEGLFVEPAVNRRGLGSVLLSRAERAATQRGVGRLEVEVPLGAVPFFGHRGYRMIAQREQPSRGGFLMMLARMGRDLA